MRIRVKLFALMAEKAGTREVEMEVAAGTTVGKALAGVREKFPAMPWMKGTMLAVNESFVVGEEVLAEGDVVAVIPPVSGG